MNGDLISLHVGKPGRGWQGFHYESIIISRSGFPLWIWTVVA